eukprot:CAMPEP_0176454904 /NCGR_PEP_ID=MMETSP0127-20121128/30271_1 /TAXON_ID=938130 /ORGANISM="Platyophrya macrostoma, Strain WH" /LENGTH=95 /DNA_ID=CAMNT_0017844363 /DNA_START=1 /DNA_END=285 /DNA_ORIENTATION=+
MFTQTKLYDELLSQIVRIVANDEALGYAGDEDDKGDYHFDFQIRDVEVGTETEEYRVFTKKLEQFAWGGRSLKYVLLKTLAGLVLEAKYIDAAKL